MKAYLIEHRTLTEQPAAVVSATMDVKENGMWIGGVCARVAALLERQGLAVAGPPFASYHVLGNEQFVVSAGFPTTGPIQPEGDIIASTLPGGTVATTVHLGPYEELGGAYEALGAWITEHGFRAAGDMWEVYFSDPVTQPDPATWRTEVYAPFVTG